MGGLNLPNKNSAALSCSTPSTIRVEVNLAPIVFIAMADHCFKAKASGIMASIPDSET